MPRLVIGPEYCGKSALSATNAASASGSFFSFIICTAAAKRACGSPLSGTAGLVPADTVGFCAGVLRTPGAPFLEKPEQPATSSAASPSATNLLECFIDLDTLLALGIAAGREA